MERRSSILVVTLSVLLTPAASSAAAWNVPSNMRVVQKSNVDVSGRIYGNIQDAINSLSGCTVTAPCLVKVMPGRYDLGTGQLVMRSNIDLAGSGRGNTIITSSRSEADISGCTTGTVVMASDSTIRDLTVENRAPALNGAGTANGIVFNQIKARAEGVAVTVGSTNVFGAFRNDGICMNGTPVAADVTLDNVTVEAFNGGDTQANPVMIVGITGNFQDPHPVGTLTVTNSRLYARSPSGGCHSINDDTAGEFAGFVKVSNTTARVDCAGGYGLFVGANALEIANSSFEVTSGGYWGLAFWATGDVRIVNTRFYGRGWTDPYVVDPSRVRVVGSQLPGNLQSLVGATLLNNYDAEFLPIPNQP